MVSRGNLQSVWRGALGPPSWSRALGSDVPAASEALPPTNEPTPADRARGLGPAPRQSRGIARITNSSSNHRVQSYGGQSWLKYHAQRQTRTMIRYGSVECECCPMDWLWPPRQRPATATVASASQPAGVGSMAETEIACRSTRFNIPAWSARRDTS